MQTDASRTEHLLSDNIFISRVQYSSMLRGIKHYLIFHLYKSDTIHSEINVPYQRFLSNSDLLTLNQWTSYPFLFSLICIRCIPIKHGRLGLQSWNHSQFASIFDNGNLGLIYWSLKSVVFFPFPLTSICVSSFRSS